MNTERRQKLVVIGGGTGTFTVLTGFREHARVRCHAIVSIADDGGSTGELRDMYGVLPPGDLRQAFIALSRAPEDMRDIMNYRYETGSLAPHALGNILLTAMQQKHGTLEGIRRLHQVLQVDGEVIPVSALPARLSATLEDGSELTGEHRIDEAIASRSPIRSCRLSPEVEANPAAIAAIRDAHVIVLGPGDLYTSIIPNLLVRGIREALASTHAIRLFVMNLATKLGQTDGYTASQFLTRLSAVLDPARLDVVLVNNERPSTAVAEHYRRANEPPVEDDLGLSFGATRVVRRALLAGAPAEQVVGDTLRRSLMRHDPQKLAKAIMELVAEKKE